MYSRLMNSLRLQFDKDSSLTFMISKTTYACVKGCSLKSFMIMQVKNREDK